MTIAITVGLLTFGAFYLFSKRELLRVILGMVLLGHAGNLAILAAGGTDRQIIERAALALLDYIEGSPDGFRILVRDSPVSHSVGTFSSLLTDVSRRVEVILARQLRLHSYPIKDAAVLDRMVRDLRERAAAKGASVVVGRAYPELEGTSPERPGTVVEVSIR